MSGNIKVVVRPRPLDLSKKEKWAPGFEVHGRRITLGAKTFDPDVTTNPAASQSEVYDHCNTIIEAVKNGCNGTIMVYGQTSTGKTHTMLGRENDGVAFQAMEDLIDYVRQGSMNGRQMSLTIAMLEIYNEKVTDMLADSMEEVTLINGHPHGATRKNLSNMQDAYTIVKEGLEFRHISPTAMNEHSSRSHVILMLDLAEVDINGKADVTHLFLVDLAGSECIKKSNVSGKAAAEAGMINRSLLALKTVVLTLSNTTENTKPAHVPYRDSKLTSMLQDSIGGTARTLMIACVSPIGRDLEETKSTLEYACKARTIRNVANTERDKLSVKIRGMEVEIQRLRNRLEDRISEKNGYFIAKAEHERMGEMEAENTQLKEDLETLRKVATDAQANRNVMEGQVAMFKSMLQEKCDELDAVKVNFVEATRKVQETEAFTINLCNKAIDEMNQTWTKANDKFVKNYSKWHHQAQEEDFISPYIPQIEEHCRNIQDKCNTFVHKFKTAHEEMTTQLKEAEAKEQQRVDDFKTEISKLVCEKVDQFAAGSKRCNEEREAIVNTNTELMNVYVQRFPDVTNGTGIRHMMESVRDEILVTAKPFTVPAPVPEAINQATNEFHAKMEAMTRQNTAEFASQIVSIPPIPLGASTPILSGGGAGGGGNNASFASNGAGPAPSSRFSSAKGLVDRGDNNARDGSVKRRNTFNTQEELMKRRVRRESVANEANNANPQA